MAVIAAAVAGRLDQPEVGHQAPAGLGVQEDVARLDVPMDQARLVGRAQAGQALLQDGQRLVHAQEAACRASRRSSDSPSTYCMTKKWQPASWPMK